jgi:hypothetical protein
MFAMGYGAYGGWAVHWLQVSNIPSSGERLRNVNRASTIAGVSKDLSAMMGSSLPAGGQSKPSRGPKSAKPSPGRRAEADKHTA